MFAGAAGGNQTGEGDSWLDSPVTDPTPVVTREVSLMFGVRPAGGHEDVVAAHHLLAHAAAQVEGRAAERLPAS